MRAGSPCGSKKVVPPPSTTSAVPKVAYCSATDSSERRLCTCAAKAAGVASVTAEVTATPVAMPAAFAASISVPHGRPSGVTETYPLFVFFAHDHAVAPAAESVISASADAVRACPLSSGSRLSAARAPFVPPVARR